MKPGVAADRTRDIVFAGLAILSVFLVWHLATSLTALGKLMPGPAAVVWDFVVSFVEPIGPYRLVGHIAWSMSRVLVGYAAAAILGVALGLTMGWYEPVEALLRPIIETVRPIPPIAWIPIAILWFGLAEMPKYFIIFLAAFNNIVINAYKGAQSVDMTLVGAAKMLGANDRQVFTTIAIPASLPYIFAGLQVGLSVSFTVLLAAEMVRSTEGVGWIIINGMAINDTTQIFVGIIAIGLVGFALATIMRGISSRLLAWNRSES